MQMLGGRADTGSMDDGGFSDSYSAPRQQPQRAPQSQRPQAPAIGPASNIIDMVDDIPF